MAEQTLPAPVAIPTLGGYPLVGTVPTLLKNPKLIFDQAAEMGDIVRVKIGPFSAYVVNHPDLFKHMFVDNNRNYGKGGAIWNTFRQILGNGLPVSEGSFWLRQRRLMQPAFHKQHMADFLQAMVEETMVTHGRLAEAATAGDVRLLPEEMGSLTMRIIVRGMFSQGLDHAEIEEFIRAFKDALKYIEYRSWLFFIPADFPMPGKTGFEAAYNILNRIIMRIITTRRASGAHESDLLSMLINARDADDGTGMTDEQLRDEVLNIFLAGYETTTIALEWIWYNLSTHPDAEAKLHEELDAVLGGRAPQLADLANLTYTKMVIDESLRLYPSAWLLTRNANETEQIGGQTIPKGALLLFSFYHLHRNPAFWEQPEQFIPERFADATPAIKRAYMPFGNGPRYCIGSNFAMMEMQVIIATLAQQFRLRVQPTKPVEPKPAVSLHPNQALPFVVEGR
jgi:cytochrome P450